MKEGIKISILIIFIFVLCGASLPTDVPIFRIYRTDGFYGSDLIILKNSINNKSKQYEYINWSGSFSVLGTWYVIGDTLILSEGVDYSVIDKNMRISLPTDSTLNIFNMQKQLLIRDNGKALFDITDYNILEPRSQKPPSSVKRIYELVEVAVNGY